jgi:hypothetical protein
VVQGGARWCSRLRHCAVSRKVVGSISHVVSEIFHLINPSGRPMSHGLTQPLTERNTRDISCGKSGHCLGLTTLSP